VAYSPGLPEEHHEEGTNSEQLPLVSNWSVKTNYETCRWKDFDLYEGIIKVMSDETQKGIKVFFSLGWSGSESTWYVGHYLAKSKVLIRTTALQPEK
jgi:hypothetical protein